MENRTFPVVFTTRPPPFQEEPLIVPGSAGFPRSSNLFVSEFNSKSRENARRTRAFVQNLTDAVDDVDATFPETDVVGTITVIKEKTAVVATRNLLRTFISTSNEMKVRLTN